MGKLCWIGVNTRERGLAAPCGARPEKPSSPQLPRKCVGSAGCAGVQGTTGDPDRKAPIKVVGRGPLWNYRTKPLPQPPPRNGEGEQARHVSSSPPLLAGEGVGGRGFVRPRSGPSSTRARKSRSPVARWFLLLQ